MNIKMFYVGLCLALLLFFLPVTPIFAAVGIDISQGVVGSVVTVTGLQASQNYLVKWDGIVCAASMNPPSGSVTFTVPETTGSSHSVVVESPQGTPALSGVFTVIPAITISPESGTAGTTISVSGKGFAASETITVTYDGTTMKSDVAASTTGSWSTTFTAPASPGGARPVGASGTTTSAANVEKKNFTVKATIAVEPLSGSVGTAVTVKGSGFVASESGIKVIFDGKNMKTGIAADSAGSWSTTFNVPRSSGGDHVIDASGSTTSSTDIADVDFSVISGIGIDKSTVYVGDPIEIKGTGFGQNETGISVTIDGVVQGSSVTADENGEWSVSLNMPAGVNGAHTINARGNTTAANSALNRTITVLAKIALSPTGGNVGDAISVTGTGFRSDKTVAMTYGGDPVPTGASTDATGSFTASFKAPKGKHGAVNVVATGADGITASSTFAMETTSPPVPVITYPKSGKTVGIIGDTKVGFEWTDVTDPSGVYYDLQVASDQDFKNMVIDHSGLTTSEYKSTDAEVLSHGEYYWRIRAVDGAGNASEWTAATRLKAGFMALSTFIIILIVAVVLIAIVLRVRAVFSKR